MSSPGGGKVTRAVQPWPKDYHTPVATMDTDKILRSTLTEEIRTEKGDTKTCLGDSIVVENFGKRARSSNDGPFKIVRTNWSVCMYVMCQTYQ